MSYDIIEKVAAATNSDPLSMPPLYDVIDPQALDRVLTADTTVRITFEYDGHTITATSAGEITVDC